MDIFSHGLWSGAAAKAMNKKIKAPLKTRWVVFWGVFPDLFAFTVPSIILFYKIIFGQLEWADWPRPVKEPPPTDALNIFQGTEILYRIGHSAIVFFIVFFAVWFVRKRLVWELGAWLFHILVDIPTHSLKFYPTPVLWPFYDWKFNGFLWSEPWFLIPNYLAILVIYIWLRNKNKKI